MDISIVIPVYNESGNLEILYNKLRAVLNILNKRYEIIFIDDGSKDNSFEILKNLNEKDKNVKIIKFRKNFGQTAALDAGFKLAKNEIVIQMDGDLQNDPEDIPNLINKLDKYDVVVGWRYKRKDPLSKTIPSLIARYLRKKITKERIHDSGCSLKAIKKICLNDLNLYGEMHRFIPTLLIWKGFKIGEVKVRHNPRRYGKTKYNFTRIIRGFLDLMNAKFWADYSTRPLHFFAKISFLLIFLGVIIVAYKFFIALLYFGISLDVGPMLLAAVLFIIVGIQFFSFGFISELQVRNYFSEKKNKPYQIEKIYK